MPPARKPQIVKDREERLRKLQQQQRTASAVPPPQPMRPNAAQPINPNNPKPSQTPEVGFSIPGSTGGARPATGGAQGPQAPAAQSFGSTMNQMGGAPVPTVGQPNAAQRSAMGGRGAQGGRGPVGADGQPKSTARRVEEGESPIELYRRGEISATELRDFTGQARGVNAGAAVQDRLASQGQGEIQAEQRELSQQEAQRQAVEQRREQMRFEQQLKMEGLSQRDVQEYNRRLEGINELEASGRYEPEDIEDFRAQVEEWRAGVQNRPKPLEAEDSSPQEQFEQSIVEFNGRKGQFINGQFRELPQAEQEGPDPREAQKQEADSLKEWQAAAKDLAALDVKQNKDDATITPERTLAHMMQIRAERAEAIEKMREAGMLPPTDQAPAEDEQGAEGAAGEIRVFPEHGPLQKGPDGKWYPIEE